MTHGKKERRVQEIAYLLWEKEGAPHGAADRHWIEAEALYEVEIAEGDSAVERKAMEGEPPGDVVEAPASAKTKAAKTKPTPKEEPKAAAPKAKVAAKKADAPAETAAAMKASAAPKRKAATPKGVG